MRQHNPYRNSHLWHISVSTPLAYKRQYATLSLHAGMDVKTLQDSLEHATAAFTLDVYGHSTDQMKQRAAEELEKLIFGQK